IITTERIGTDLSKLRPNLTDLTWNGLPKQNIETVRNQTVCQDNTTAACAGIGSAGLGVGVFGPNASVIIIIIAVMLLVILFLISTWIICACYRKHYKRHRRLSWQNRRLAGTHPLHTPSTLMPVELCTKGTTATYNLPRVYVTPGNRPETSQPSDRKYMTHNEQRALNQSNYLNTPININGNMSEGRCEYDAQANQREANTLSTFGYATTKVLTMYPSVKHEPIPGTRVRDSGMQNAYAVARVNSCDCPDGLISTNQGTMQVVADEYHVDMCEPDMSASPRNVSTFLKQIYIEPDCKGKQTRAIRRG
ncbi:hypothetical protein EG68_06360, partial [Paragonimus skrjabini miyazakii]